MPPEKLRTFVCAVDQSHHLEDTLDAGAAFGARHMIENAMKAEVFFRRDPVVETGITAHCVEQFPSLRRLLCPLCNLSR